MNWRIFKTVYSRKIKWIWTTCINTDTDTYLKLKSCCFFSFDFYYLAIGKLGAKKHTSNIPRYLSYIFNRDDERVHSILYHLITPGRRLRSKITWFDNDKNGVYLEVDMNDRTVIFVNNLQYFTTTVHSDGICSNL